MKIKSSLKRMATIGSAVLLSTTFSGCSSDSNDSDAAAAAAAALKRPVASRMSTLAAQIGGASSAITQYEDAAHIKWALYSMANRFAATPIGITKGAVSEITVPGYIQHITQVTFGDKSYALLSMGGKGIGIVDITDPMAMALLNVVNVNYEQAGLVWVDGGGTPTDGPQTISGTAGPINDVITDGTTVWIADGAYGIHQTALSNLLPVPVTEPDGTLKIDKEIFTLQYAGENPWGGPLSLKLHGGKLYAALGFLGIGIYTPVASGDVADPAAQIIRDGGYNLYVDEAQNEDWFGSRKLSEAVQNPAWVDPVTGMPTWEQAQYEIDEIWRNKAECLKDWCTPWASFDRYGKYYYNARTLDLVDLPGAKTMAYVAYSLGGLVAVDVTNSAAPAYAGYVPAVPAHGPDEPTGQQSKSIFPHFGSGMLKESGVMDVQVDGDKAYYSDHFAGLVVVSGADNPGAHWNNAGGPNGGKWNNDTKPEEFWPDYEFVSSYDMTPVPVGDESMPRFLTEPYLSPVMLATGEISGHGGPLFLMPSMNTAAAGGVDLVQATGAGGVNFIDIKDFNGATLADRFEVPVHLVSTDELGAAADGSPTQPMAIGHAEGVTVSGDYLYLADGPHGMSVWRITDENGKPTDELHLVANTLQSEYPTDGILPTPHAFKVGFGADLTQAYVLTQSLGLRRVDVSAVTDGSAEVGAPALLGPLTSDIYEHSTELGGNIGDLNSQDHAYGVAFTGNYAVVADGGNGLTVYDITDDPSTGEDHVVANIGGSDKKKPILGRSAAVKLWTDRATDRKYAIVAAGSYGVSVVDMTDLLDKGIKPGMTLVKTFEPKKYDEDKVGSADGKSVDVHIVGDYAYFSYDSFGLVAYALSDLIQPVVEFQPVDQLPGACADVTDVTKLSAKQGRTVDCRPESVGRFKLQTVPGYETMDGGALYMTSQFIPGHISVLPNDISYVDPQVLFYVAYGDAGVVKLDWTDPANPLLVEHHDTVGSAAGTAIANGRVYVADGTGGLAVLK